MNLKSQIHRISCFPYRHFECSREIFLALCSFLLLSRKVSPFPLSHIGRYTSVPERSLDFARDNVAKAAFSKHIRCTLREISPFPPPSFRAQREIFLALCSFLLLSRKHSRFLLSHIRRYTSMQERSLDFARDDVTEMAFSQHILHTGRGLPIPPYRHFQQSREIFLALCSFLLLSQKVSPFPLSHIGRYTGVSERSLGFARDDVAEAAFSQHILHTGRGLPIPHTVISSKVEKSSSHSTFSCSFRRWIPVFRYHTYGAIPVCQKDPSTSLGMTIQE